MRTSGGYCEPAAPGVGHTVNGVWAAQRGMLAPQRNAAAVHCLNAYLIGRFSCPGEHKTEQTLFTIRDVEAEQRLTEPQNVVCSSNMDRCVERRLLYVVVVAVTFTQYIRHIRQDD